MPINPETCLSCLPWVVSSNWIIFSLTKEPLKLFCCHRKCIDKWSFLRTCRMFVQEELFHYLKGRIGRSKSEEVSIINPRKEIISCLVLISLCISSFLLMNCRMLCWAKLWHQMNFRGTLLRLVRYQYLWFIFSLAYSFLLKQARKTMKKILVCIFLEMHFKGVQKSWPPLTKQTVLGLIRKL